MEIKHVTGEIVETNNLGDVDAILMEECKNLYELFKQYNRVFLISADIKGKEEQKNRGCHFFHLENLDAKPEDINKAFIKQMDLLDSYIKRFSGDQYCIARIIK